jgi:cardiolipin synthase
MDRRSETPDGDIVKLLIQPDDGLAPLVEAVKRAQKTIDIAIFRFDQAELEKALAAAVTRGVVVRTLIAHTNAGGEKTLRRLELRFLAAGVIVARSADDLVRYHGKYLIVDRQTLYLLGFNYTLLDTRRSRSFGLVTAQRDVVNEALKLFESDVTRQPYTSSNGSLVVSPENARERLTRLIKGARKQLLIYDPRLTDNAMIRLLQEQAKAGVDIKILGRLEKPGGGLQHQRMPKYRLHVRAIVRDGALAFVGSQSLRRLELDFRREVGQIVKAPTIVKRIESVFAADWAATPLGRQTVKAQSGEQKPASDLAS